MTKLPFQFFVFPKNSHLRVKYSFDHFTKKLKGRFSLPVLLSIVVVVVCASARCLFRASTHVSRPPQKISSNANLVWLYQWEMAARCNKVSPTHIFIRRGVDKPFLHSNAVLFPSVLVRLHCSANKREETPSWALGFLKTILLYNAEVWRFFCSFVVFFFFLFFCTDAIHFLWLSSRSCDL